MSDVLDLVAELTAALDLSEWQRRALVRVLRRRVGGRIFFARRDLQRPAELALAVDLMGQMPMADASKALQARLSCRKTKAYKLLGLALQARSKQVRSGGVGR